MSYSVRNHSASVLLVASALLAGCGETDPVGTASFPASAQTAANSNASNAKACQKNGWQNLATATNSSFASEEACVAYGAQGGVLYKKQTITFAALAAKTFGTADFAIAATASSGLTTTFSATGNCTVTVNTVHLTGAGSCTITAHQAGNSTWAPAPDVARTFAIAKGNQTVAFTSASPSFTIKGATPYAVAANASSGLPVALSLDATSTGCALASGAVSFTGAGICVIDANQAGNADWNPASQQQQSITVYPCIETEAQLRYAAGVGGSYEFCGVGTRIVLTTGQLVVNATLSLAGLGGVNAVIDANGNGRVIYTFADLTLRDVTVTGGRGVNEGGGLLVKAGTTVLNGKAAIDGNSAEQAGGVFLALFTTLILNDASTISNNTAYRYVREDYSEGYGGGIINSFSTMIMNGSSTITKNISKGHHAIGGGMLLRQGTLTMNESSSITENSAIGAAGDGVGGGVWSTIGTLTLNGSASITRNSATFEGGGIYRPNGLGTMTGVTATNVTNNTPNNCAGVAINGCVP